MSALRSRILAQAAFLLLIAALRVFDTIDFSEIRPKLASNYLEIFSGSCAHLGNNLPCCRALRWPALMKLGLNLVGPQVRKWRDNRGWSQEGLACKLQLQGWSVTRHSLAKLELGLRRVSDCELFFLARVLRVDLRDLFPKQMPLKELGPTFQGGRRISIFPTRGEK